MFRQYFGLFALVTVVVAPASLWAADGRSDTEIAHSIVKALQQKQQAKEIRGFNIGVRVDAGDVWMEGNVSKTEHRDLILDVAKRQPGVKQVIDDIQVTPPESPPQEVDEPESSDTPVPASSNATSGLIEAAMVSRARPIPWQRSFAESAKETADRVIKAIRSKNESGELTGFDVVVDGTFTPAVYLTGRVADEQTRDLLLKTLRDETGISPASCHIKIAEEGTELPDKVTPGASHVYAPYPYPVYAPSPRPIMEWEDGWWQLDFKSKKHR
jgi:osmotically-inducible protein OsmY